jgi:hypothetical protein
MSIIRELGLLYDSSPMADDDPYELEADGAPTGVVELPLEWVRGDAAHYGFVRFRRRPRGSRSGVARAATEGRRRRRLLLLLPGGGPRRERQGQRAGGGKGAQRPAVAVRHRRAPSCGS